MAVNSTVFDWKVFKSLKLHVVQPVQIATTNLGNCALLLTQSGKVFAIGKGSVGCLGLGEVTETAEPVELKELSGVTGVCVCGCFDDKLAYTSVGNVYVWGNNVSWKRPQLVPELTDVVDARCTEGHYLALTKSGKLYEWRGVNTSIDALSKTPKVVTLNEAITSIACGPHHSLALTKDGQVYFWGKKYISSEYSYVDQPMTKINLPGDTVAKVACGAVHSLVLTHSDKLYTWGCNYYGGLGDPSGSTESATPVQVGLNIGSVSPKKTQVIPFTRRRKLESFGPLFLRGSGIAIATEVKYLGVILDQRLNFNAQLNRVIDRGNNREIKTPTITKHLEMHQVFANIPRSNYSWIPKLPSSNTEVVKDSSSVAGKLKASCNDEQDSNEAAIIQPKGHLEQSQTNADCDHAESKIHHLEEYVKNLKKERAELKEENIKLKDELKKLNAKLIAYLKEDNVKLKEENYKFKNELKNVYMLLIDKLQQEENGKHNEAAITQPEERGLQLPVYLAQLEHDPINVDSSNNIEEDNVNLRKELAKLQDRFKNLTALLFPQE